MGNTFSSFIFKTNPTYFENTCPIQYLYNVRELLLLLWANQCVIIFYDRRSNNKTNINKKDYIPEFARFSLTLNNIPFVVINTNTANYDLQNLFKSDRCYQNTNEYDFTPFNCKFYIPTNIDMAIYIIKNNGWSNSSLETHFIKDDNCHNPFLNINIFEVPV